MAIDAMKSRLFGHYTFTVTGDKRRKPTEFREWAGKKIYGEHHKDLIYEYGITDTICDAVFAIQSDENAINATALRYIGKILESKKEAMTKGMESADVLQIIADCYAFASWEYMHRRNFITDIENALSEKYPDVHFVVKTICPFLSSRLNWFLEFLKLNPASLFVNIKRLANMDGYIAKLNEKRRKGDMSTPSSQWAEVMIRRNIGLGVIGTLLWGLGAMLGAFGIIRRDDDDDKFKVRVGDTWMDISSIYGSSALLVGASLCQPNSKRDFFEVLKDACNQQLEDGMTSQFMDMFRPGDTPTDYLLSIPTTVVGTFIPNVWKSVVKLTRNHEVKYDKGIVGNLQYLSTQLIPFIEYALPKSIDPYTGEWQSKYSVPVIHQLASLIGSPVSFNTPHISDVESEFIELEMNKGMLKGEYDDIGKIDKILLNQYYGKLNNRTLTDCINNKTKYKVLNKITNKYETLYYKDMSNEQKKSVLNRITTQNAKYAKIYVWTNDGHKYYCTNDERLELMQIGITKNVYIKSGKKDGFVP
jgi:hypothetical protein